MFYSETPGCCTNLTVGLPGQCFVIGYSAPASDNHFVIVCEADSRISSIPRQANRGYDGFSICTYILFSFKIKSELC